MSRGMEQLPGEQGRVHEQQLLTRNKRIIFIKNIVVLRKITNFAAGLQTKNNKHYDGNYDYIVAHRGNIRCFSGPQVNNKEGIL